MRVSTALPGKGGHFGLRTWIDLSATLLEHVTQALRESDSSDEDAVFTRDTGELQVLTENREEKAASALWKVPAQQQTHLLPASPSTLTSLTNTFH